MTPDESPIELKCPNCGLKAEEGTRYCKQCGAHVYVPNRTQFLTTPAKSGPDLSATQPPKSSFADAARKFIHRTILRHPKDNNES